MTIKRQQPHFIIIAFLQELSLLNSSPLLLIKHKQIGYDIEIFQQYFHCFEISQNSWKQQHFVSKEWSRSTCQHFVFNSTTTSFSSNKSKRGNWADKRKWITKCGQTLNLTWLSDPSCNHCIAYKRYYVHTDMPHYSLLLINMKLLNDTK